MSLWLWLGVVVEGMYNGNHIMRRVSTLSYNSIESGDNVRVKF